MNVNSCISTSPTQETPLSSSNILHLKGSESTFYQEEVVVNFQPVKAIDPYLSPHRLSTFSILPTFNHDQKYYTVSFVNPFDEESDEDERVKTQHETRVREFSTEIALDDILLPKPRNPDPFCCVCKQVYSDYLEHINASKHLRLIKNARFTRLINELSDTEFPKTRRSRRVMGKSRR